MSNTPCIIGLGEALFDVFPDETRLGGAPLNVAVHAAQLGNASKIITRVGEDILAESLFQAVASFGVDTQFIQSDPVHPTGQVTVRFDHHGEPSYDIAAAAWDHLQVDPRWASMYESLHGVCFGTLAQRHGESKAAIHHLLTHLTHTIRLYDINIRPGGDAPQLIAENLTLADAIKLNDDELNLLIEPLGLPNDHADVANALINQYELTAIMHTRGAQGSVIYSPQGIHTAAPVKADMSDPNANPVGAGDATAAALLHGMTRGWDFERTLVLANTLGAYVAGQAGACPVLPDEILALA